MYEKFYNSDFNSTSIVDNVTYAFESRETFTESEINRFKYLNQFFQPSTISLEADDDPFGDIGEDDGGMDAGADDNPFGDIGDVGGDDGGGDPFGGDDGGGGFDFDSASDDSGDIFGDDGGGSEEDAQKAKEKALLLDRAKSIKEDYDISRQIRANFPKKFLELKQIVLTNVNILERTVLDKQEYDETLRGMIVEYDRMYELIEAYLEVMAKKTYEDIFATYVSIHTSLIRLKNLYIKITGIEKDDIEQEESKYSDTI